MPELPEVETIRRQLEPLVVGRRLTSAWAFPHPKFTAALEVVGATITGTTRRGKYLLLTLDDGRELVVHLGMTGSLRVRPAGDSGDAYVRAWWGLDDPARGAGEAGDASRAGQALEYRDVRRFGRIAVAEDGQYAGTLAVQGPDALDRRLTPEEFWRALRRSRRAVKTQLLSQRPIAGVGNIYADEALWQARVNPFLRTVTRAQAAALLDAVRQVLAGSLHHGGTTLTSYRNAEGLPGRNQQRLNVYGQAGLPCPRCGTELRSRVLDGRTTTWCPTCQPGPGRASRADGRSGQVSRSDGGPGQVSRSDAGSGQVSRSDAGSGQASRSHGRSGQASRSHGRSGQASRSHGRSGRGRRAKRR
jgi:formamidopyrimidine-DNA glycosylase